MIKPSLSNNWPNGECVHFKAPRHASKQDGSARNMIEPTMKLSNVPKFHIFEQKKQCFVAPPVCGFSGRCHWKDNN